MNEAKRGFEAYVFHPACGNEVVSGRIFADRWKLRFQSDRIAFEIPLDQLVIEPAEDGERIFLSDRNRPEVKLFTFDQSVLSHWALAQSPNVRGQVRQFVQRGETRRRLLLTLYVFLACGLLAWLGSLLAGGAVRVVISRIPLSWDAKEGNALIGRLEKKLPFVTNSNVVAQLTTLAGPLTSAVPANGVQFKFHVLADPEPNAFALPGGHIVVTTGLLDLAGRSEDLLGVLAHEMAHITQRHALRQEISGRGPFFMVQILTGGRNRALAVLALPSELLAYESFSQEYEREADSIGWNYLVAAKINPHGMIDMFRKMEGLRTNADGKDSLPAFESHPAFERRIVWLKAKWEKLPDKNGFIVLTNPVPKLESGDFSNAVEKMLARPP